jgi:hypothetical protein
MYRNGAILSPLPLLLAKPQSLQTWLQPISKFESGLHFTLATSLDRALLGMVVLGDPKRRVGTLNRQAAPVWEYCPPATTEGHTMSKQAIGITLVALLRGGNEANALKVNDRQAKFQAKAIARKMPKGYFAHEVNGTTIVAGAVDGTHHAVFEDGVLVKGTQARTQAGAREHYYKLRNSAEYIVHSAACTTAKVEARKGKMLEDKVISSPNEFRVAGLGGSKSAKASTPSKPSKRQPKVTGSKGNKVRVRQMTEAEKAARAS